MTAGEQRHGVELTNLDQPLSAESNATKRDLVDYLDAVANRLLPGLTGRPLTVLRVLRGRAFMQKNVPAYTPEWVATVSMWAETSQREVHYPLCDDRRTLIWLANQRAIEYHPTLGLADNVYRPTHLVLDLDPPTDDDFAAVVTVAHLVHRALRDADLAGVVKTSGAKGLHVFVPVDDAVPVDDVAAATRALAARTEALDPDVATTAFIVADRGGRVFVDSTRAGGATVVAAYSPRFRPGTPVSFPVAWSDLDRIHPTDFTVRTAIEALDGGDPWAEAMPASQRLPTDLIEHGRTIPVARVAAMHEGKRRARARRAEGGTG
ncbi:ATP-dependent DNA ligase [Mycolicibacterium sp. 624]|uniref:DNA polymerase domain-containing protein n=1 Tax=Mycolicibacterium sp. 624 TaxID=3156314 RepID=UPI0033933A1D